MKEIITNQSQVAETFGFTNIEGASKITGLSTSKLYKLTAKKALPHYKPCGKLMFKIQDLVTWIEASRQG